MASWRKELILKICVDPGCDAAHTSTFATHPRLIVIRTFGKRPTIAKIRQLRATGYAGYQSTGASGFLRSVLVKEVDKFLGHGESLHSNRLDALEIERNIFGML